MSSSSLFGNKLREALKIADLSQKEASVMLGISPGSMTNYVHGRIPEAEILLNISRLCNKPMEWFLTGQDAVRYEKINPDLGVRICDAIVWNGMTIKELAESLVVTEEEVDRIGQGFLADPGVLADLCRILNVTSDWLLNGEGDGPPCQGEFISAQNSFFSALAKFIAHITLIDREDLRQALAGNAPAEILLPQNGLRDELLASLQVLLRSPAWTRRLQGGHAQAWPVSPEERDGASGADAHPAFRYDSEQNTSAATEKYPFKEWGHTSTKNVSHVAERDETAGQSEAGRSRRSSHSPDESTVEETGLPISGVRGNRRREPR